MNVILDPPGGGTVQSEGVSEWKPRLRNQILLLS